jgi:hypothetical protein
MFTKEFIIESARQYRFKKDAKTLLYKIKQLGITSKIVKQQCNTIINNAKDFNRDALEYMYSFVPKELKQKLEIVKLSGAFACEVQGEASLNAELSIHLKDSILYLKFDNVKKCLYHQSWMEDHYAPLLDNYFQNNPDFNSWLHVSFK